jgi:hypothetical protein
VSDPEELIRNGERICSEGAAEAIDKLIETGVIHGAAVVFVLSRTDVHRSDGRMAYVGSSVMRYTNGESREEILRMMQDVIARDLNGDLTVRTDNG